MENKTVDARGLACPLPVIQAKEAADAMHEGGMLTVLVDNEVAVQNLTKFAGSRNYELSVEKKAENAFSLRMLVKESGEPSAQSEVISCVPAHAGEGTVVVISGSMMGTGDEVLGKKLMKAFIFALSKQDILPSVILCYNGGAFLTCEGSENLEDLKQLEAEGVKIMTCGTCLDHYGIKEKLAVGTVTNMYDIVETQMKAARIIRP